MRVKTEEEQVELETAHVYTQQVMVTIQTRERFPFCML